MNILLWIVQGILALLCGAGGAYKTFNTAELMTVPPNGNVSRGVWVALGVFEMLCAVLLILPMLMKRMPALTPLAAAAVTVENVVLALVVFAPYSMKLSAQNPLVWVVLAAVLAAVVAVGRRPASTLSVAVQPAGTTGRAGKATVGL